MYMNGHGPMMGGHRGPMMGAPMHHHRHMGGPGMGFGSGFRSMYRPMRMYHHRPMGFFPLGGLFILPALMFGGWIVVAVLGGILGLVRKRLGSSSGKERSLSGLTGSEIGNESVDHRGVRLCRSVSG